MKLMKKEKGMFGINERMNEGERWKRSVRDVESYRVEYKDTFLK